MPSHNPTTARIEKSTMSSRRFWSVAALLVCLDFAAAGNGNNIGGGSGNGNFVSLKLTSRKAVLDRRRRERRQLGIEEDDSDVDVDEDRRSRRRADAVQVGALFEGYGTHYVDLWCGTPPQRQTVIVDTGSGVTAFPCSECKDCGTPDYHIDRVFIEKDSSTYQKTTCTGSGDCIMSRSNCRGNTCKIGMSYAEGSRWDAEEVVDRCYIAGPHETPLVVSNPDDAPIHIADDLDPNHAADLAFDMTFACQSLVTNLFKTQLADGIMGMSNQQSTYWSQMFLANKMGSDKTFGLCFSRPDVITKEGTEAGAMTLGGVDQRLHKTEMVYTPNFNNGRSTFFSVKVRRFMLRDGKYGLGVKSTSKNPNEGVRVLDVPAKTLNAGGVIVDSGTTDTYWNAAIGSHFKSLFKEMSGGMIFDNKGHKMSQKELEALPTILIQLESDFKANSHIEPKMAFKTPGLAGAMDTDHQYDVILAIPPTHYMEYSPDKDTFTNRFYPDERGGSVLGANAMMGHDISFDVVSQRIGWAESDCDYTSAVTTAGYDFAIDGDLKNVQTTNGNGNDDGGSNGGDSTKCEDIRSGTKCDRSENCKWNWGKCKTQGGDAAAATAAPTDGATEETTASTDTESFGGDQNGDDNPTAAAAADLAANLVVIGQDHTLEIGIGLGVLVLICGCGCFWCCCQSSRNRSGGAKYARTGTDPTIEMTNGVSTFQDEPEYDSDDDDEDEDDDDDEDDIEEMDGSRKSNGSKQFRDDPTNGNGRQPEFDGDFM